MEERCLDELQVHKSKAKIWNECHKHFLEECGANYRGMNRQQVKKLVDNMQRQDIGGDTTRRVEKQYGGNIDSAFLRHISTFVDEKCMQRMMCFSLPALLSLLVYTQVSAYIYALLLRPITFCI